LLGSNSGVKEKGTGAARDWGVWDNVSAFTGEEKENEEEKKGAASVNKVHVSPGLPRKQCPSSFIIRPKLPSHTQLFLSLPRTPH
jgi:hypothetical protein